MRHRFPGCSGKKVLPEWLIDDGTGAQVQGQGFLNVAAELGFVFLSIGGAIPVWIHPGEMALLSRSKMAPVDGPSLSACRPTQYPWGHASEVGTANTSRAAGVG